MAQPGEGARRSFGDLVFAAFAGTLKDPKKYPQATVAFHAATQALRAVYPVDVDDDPETWPRARRLDGVVVALLDAEAGFPEDAALAAGHLLNRVACYRQAALGAYAQARSLFERALAIRERALPE